MTRQRAGSGVIFVSLLIAFLLALWPLPDYLAVFRPNWLALILCYWLLEAPGKVSLGVAFLLGLSADLVFGNLMGEQALRLCVMAFIVLRFRARLRFFTLPQQALAIGGLLLNDRVVVVMIRALSGEGWLPWQVWLAPCIGALIWPWLSVLMDDVRQRIRMREPA